MRQRAYGLIIIIIGLGCFGLLVGTNGASSRVVVLPGEHRRGQPVFGTPEPGQQVVGPLGTRFAEHRSGNSAKPVPVNKAQDQRSSVLGLAPQVYGEPLASATPTSSAPSCPCWITEILTDPHGANVCRNWNGRGGSVCNYGDAGVEVGCMVPSALGGWQICVVPGS